MTTTLSDPVQARSTTLTPSPWSVPQPDGPLAAALRDAQAQREQFDAIGPQQPPADIPIEVLPDLPPIDAHAGTSSEELALGVENLAREARAHDQMREALALALEWPDEPPGGGAAQEGPAWRGWAALAGMVVLAGAAATVAVSMSSNDGQVPPVPLKLEKSLSVPAR